VSNYRIGDREVTDPEEFYETAPKGLVYEILRAMEDAYILLEGQVKN
jgi:hypothetical protein